MPNRRARRILAIRTPPPLAVRKTKGRKSHRHSSITGATAGVLGSGHRSARFVSSPPTGRVDITRSGDAGVTCGLGRHLTISVLGEPQRTLTRSMRVRPPQRLYAKGQCRRCFCPLDQLTTSFCSSLSPDTWCGVRVICSRCVCIFGATRGFCHIVGQQLPEGLKRT